MAVKFEGRATATQWVNTSGKRLYLNADRDEVVEEGNPEAAYLLAAPGAMIPMAEAARIGLVEGKTERDYLTPLQQDAVDSTQEHNDRAAAQKMRTQMHERGVYMTMDEAVAKVREDRGDAPDTAKSTDAAETQTKAVDNKTDDTVRDKSQASSKDK